MGISQWCWGAKRRWDGAVKLGNKRSKGGKASKAQAVPPLKLGLNAAQPVRVLRVAAIDDVKKRALDFFSDGAA